MGFDFTDPRLYRPRAALYALAFEEAGLALVWQERIHSDLRARGAGLAGTATVTTTIFGGPLGAGDGSARYVAVMAFVGVGLCALGLLWPRHFDVASDARTMVREYAEPSSVPLPLVHRDLALVRSDAFARNRRRLDRMTWLLRVGLCLLAVQVVAWVVSYAQSL
ncbi:MAG TPA: hypothetical protein VFG42_15250 [Baekduia sp.]|uniref:hypothetical protein n=1 Tax=Baekduia sp. TaxID=2600305 RepID=UPI002D770E55|nr:hypothetical protein [Baekduia sp.]HET6508146.1 hypothetical protein [Baekduia sp.]